MEKLWSKGYDFDRLIEEFTVGNDYELDRALVAADCLASIAHAGMLESIGVLTPAENTALITELRKIIGETRVEGFPISPRDEDCHTAVEKRLTDVLGEAGKKIHTARSRNDQVLAALRLLERAALLAVSDALIELISTLVDFARSHRDVPMPGRTHLQIAMPSSVGLWAAAFAESFADQLHMADAVWHLIDRSPLGSAAGYGVPLKIDREYVADALGFGEVHNNVIAVSNSRGEVEAWLLSVFENIGLVVSRLAQDLLIYTLPEVGYFSLPQELCSGSSIMPQKKNPDVLELMRSRSGSLSAAAVQVRSIIRALPTGYNRDLQDTKEPTLRGIRTVLQLLGVSTHTVRKVEVRENRLEDAFTPEIFATDAAFELVEGGMPFRDAYRIVAGKISDLEDRSPREAIRKRTHTGSTGNLGLEKIERRIRVVGEEFVRRRRRIDDAQNALAGSELSLLDDLNLL